MLFRHGGITEHAVPSWRHYWARCSIMAALLSTLFHHGGITEYIWIIQQHAVPSWRHYWVHLDNTAACCSVMAALLSTLFHHGGITEYIRIIQQHAVPSWRHYWKCFFYRRLLNMLIHQREWWINFTCNEKGSPYFCYHARRWY